MTSADQEHVWIFSQTSKKIYQTNKLGNVLRAVDVDPTWSVAGICVTNTQELLVCCKGDQSIKKCTRNGDVLDLINTAPLNPVSVCYSWSKDEILVGAVEASLSDEEIFRTASGRRVVQRYSKSGKMLQEIQYESVNTPMFTYPWKLQVSITGDIAVCNMTTINEGHIVILNKHGRLVSKFFGNPDDIMDDDKVKFCPVGLCFDNNSNIAFCEAFSYSVQKVDREGKYFGVLYKDRKCPPMNIVSCSNGDLWVGCKGGKVQVLKSE
ncbi:hypothetical protein FSP39_019459 [Pinctada imbricata]|uniref:Uncharacterized protein n=1 Tax=Pinctada imbricata TaxID=66713 RepID=A0AA88YKQ4_PINIB|nr:hypothetical protein FSP39_019459 [Pinctada imbricata]